MTVAPLVAWRHKLLENATSSWRAKYVGLALSAYWDGDGRGATASVERLAREMDVSERTVQRGLFELREHGEVEAVERPGSTTVYHARGVPQAPPSDSRRGVSHSRGRGASGTPEVALEEAREGVRPLPTLKIDDPGFRICAYGSCERKRTHGATCEEHRGLA